ncbi:MAG: enoyl-CoA hydratase, partial [Solirubrobacteraceae bacterium]|nr:enoyl-CoA hydratase [Solirubrobacteraceae bacterium]
CEPGMAVEHALALAERISSNAPLAVQASREVILRSAVAVGDDEAWRITDEVTAGVMTGEDFAEGPREFIEKREPVWTGR